MTVTEPGPARFASLRELTDEHVALLDRLAHEQNEMTLSAGLQKDIVSFMEKAAATGAVLDYSEDRSEAHSYLNCWNSTLLTRDFSPRALTLAPFDSTQLAPLGSSDSPYRGFRSFQAVDTSLFFGRRSLVSRLLVFLKEHRFIAVIGVSGSGKSSLVRAGLIPVLREGALPDSTAWKYLAPMKPGTRPLDALAEVLVEVDPQQTKESIREKLAASKTFLCEFLRSRTAPALLMVDQFEELFTLPSTDADREALADNISTAVNDPDAKLYVVVTMRSDEADHIAKSEVLQALFDRGQFPIPPLRASELREAIERPVNRMGIKFEPHVVDKLIQSVLGEPAGLALLEFALLKLWEHHEGDTITQISYEALGGSPQKILAHTADGLYNSLKADPKDQDTFRQILLSLIQLGDGLKIFRRPAFRRVLWAIDEPDRVNRLIDLMGHQGFIQATKEDDPGDDLIDITHEALTHKWPTLQTWIEADFGMLRQRRLLKDNARAYKDDPSSVTLYSGRQLEDALKVKTFDPAELQFLEASKAADLQRQRAEEEKQEKIQESEARFQKQQEQAHRSRTLFKRVMVAIGVAAVVAAAFGLGVRRNYVNLADKESLLRAEYEKSAKQNADLQAIQKQLKDTQALLASLVPNSPANKLAVENAFSKNPGAAKNVSRVYVQYIDEADKDVATGLLVALRALQYLAPGAQYVPKSAPFQGIQIRYFHMTDADAAMQMADQLKNFGTLTPVYIQGFEHRVDVPVPERQFEIWIGPRKAAATPVQSPVQSPKQK